MSAGSTIVKKVKVEEEEKATAANGENNGSRVDEEETLVALIEHRTKEVEHLRLRISYYESQLDLAKKRLQDSESKLARLRGKQKTTSSIGSLVNGNQTVKVESGSTSPQNINGGVKSQPQSKTELVIPSVNPKTFQPLKSAAKSTTFSGHEASADSEKVKREKSHRSSSDVEDVEVKDKGTKTSSVKVKMEKSHRNSSEVEVVEVKDRGTKRKFEKKEHKELILLIKSSSSVKNISMCSNHIPSQHKRKLRSLALCPVNGQLFVTSALDGLVNLWQIQAGGSSASLLSTTDCASSRERRWPEDIAWHPHGNSLFSVYTAEAGDSQVSVLDLNKTQGALEGLITLLEHSIYMHILVNIFFFYLDEQGQKGRVTFLEDKPHVKGIINSIIFMPWENTCFATGGSDHAVVLWNEREENVWKPKLLHRNLHSSAVMGVAGMQQKQILLSAGADKRIIGFDVHLGRADFKHQIDSKCMSVLPNPCDFNLFMVHAGAHERQLRLYDIRLRHTELHSFGWKQESSESQSALINQAWSPDGLYLTSGSADPIIHIFDIRYNAPKPSQSIKAHHKRVFKAVWNYSMPVLISISSDLQIGLHKIAKDRYS